MKLERIASFAGLGNIGDAGIKIRANYAAFDAEQKFPLAKEYIHTYDRNAEMCGGAAPAC